MLPYQKYRQSAPEPTWTRIEMLLALYDGALGRLQQAQQQFESGNASAALGLVAKVQLIITEMAAGVRVEVDPEMGTNMLRLYEYITHTLTEPSTSNIANAIRVLSILRDGFEGVREEANQLEKSGEFAAADRLQMVHATA